VNRVKKLQLDSYSNINSILPAACQNFVFDADGTVVIPCAIDLGMKSRRNTLIYSITIETLKVTSIMSTPLFRQRAVGTKLMTRVDGYEYWAPITRCPELSLPTGS
jgi:hypothetical protein